MDKPSDDFVKSMLQHQETLLTAIEKLTYLMTEMRREVHVQTVFASSKLDITSTELKDLFRNLNQRLDKLVEMAGETEKEGQNK